MDEQVVSDPVPIELQQQPSKDSFLVFAPWIHREGAPDSREGLRLVDVTMKSEQGLTCPDHLQHGPTSDRNHFRPTARTQHGRQGFVEPWREIQAGPKGTRVDIVNRELGPVDLIS